MLAWSIQLFRIAGIRLSLHWSFLLLLAYGAWLGGREAGAAGTIWMTAYIMLLFSCVVLHELGHCFLARHFGVQVGRILLLPIGGMAEFDHVPRRPSQEVAIAIAGPTVNFLLAVALVFAGVRFPLNWEMTGFPLTVAEMGRHLVLVNLLMGCFNLIPVFPMDGGRVLRALLALRLSYLGATRFAATLGKVFAIAGAVVMVLWFEHWLGAMLFLFIFMAGEVEYRAVRRREREEAHWQQVLKRFYEAPPRVIRVPSSQASDS